MALGKILRRRVLTSLGKELLPLAIGLLFAAFLWENTLLLTVLFAALIILVLAFSYKRGDEWIFVLGFVLSLVIEGVGVAAGYQSFARPTAWGIPLWIPLAWGYGFIFVKRLGLILNEAL